MFCTGQIALWRLEGGVRASVRMVDGEGGANGELKGKVVPVDATVLATVQSEPVRGGIKERRNGDELQFWLGRQMKGQ